MAGAAAVNDVMHGFPRGGVYSGRPNRFNRFKELEETSGSEDNSNGEVEEAQGLTFEETSLFMDSLEKCSDVSSSFYGEEGGDPVVVLDSSGEATMDEMQLLRDEALWSYGKGFSYYQVELFHELFCEATQWDKEAVLPTSAMVAGDEDGADLCDDCSFLTPFEIGGCEDVLQDDDSHLFADADLGGMLHVEGPAMEYDFEDSEGIIHCFLQGWSHLRGGAGAAAVNAKKRQVNEAMQELQRQFQNWTEETPTRDSLLQSLMKVIEVLQGKSGKGDMSRDRGTRDLEVAVEERSDGSSHLHGQSFYQAMQAMRQQQMERDSGKKPGPKKPKKSSGKGTSELPRFDLKRSFPDLEILSWQNLQQMMEQGDAPSGKVTLCKSPGQVIEFQDLATAGSIKADVVLVAASGEGDPQVPGGKIILLPFLGNIALKHAVVGKLGGEEVSREGLKPAKLQLQKGRKEQDVVTLRVNIALDFLSPEDKNKVILNPSHCLHLADVKGIVDEARTFQRVGAFRMVSGYVQIPTCKEEEFMKKSGTNAIFFQRLASNKLGQPEVAWLVWEDGMEPRAYLQKALQMAKTQDTYLAFRRGGGSCIGLISPVRIHKNRHWAVFGLGRFHGPSTVADLLDRTG